MRYLIFLPLALSTLALASCIVGPNYVPPDPWVSDEWHADAAMEDPPEMWWKVFEDPQLDYYIALAIGNNPSLFAAKSHILQARALKVVAASPLFPQIAAQSCLPSSTFLLPF